MQEPSVQRFQMSLRTSLRVVLINLLVLIGGLLLVEAGFRAVIEGYSDDQAFRATQPLPYRGAPFFSAEFIDESFRQPGGWRPLPGTNAILPNDFKGKYFTVENGIRRTDRRPTRRDGHDLLVRRLDALQLRSSRRPHGRELSPARARRSGLRRLPSRQLRRHQRQHESTSRATRSATIAAGDSVVFYDGVNDVLQGVLYGNAGDTIHGNDRSRSFGQRSLYRLSKRSVAARYLLARANANYDIANLGARVAWTADRFRANLEEAERIARAKGASFSHFCSRRSTRSRAAATTRTSCSRSASSPCRRRRRLWRPTRTSNKSSPKERTTAPPTST